MVSLRVLSELPFHIKLWINKYPTNFKMIINLPTSENFKLIARDCLLQTMNNLYQIIESYNVQNSNGEIDLSESQIWDYHKADLRTCLLLVFQGLELYLKSQICNESPLLLLETSRNDWPTGQTSADRDFNDLFTISGESLIRTFNAINNNRLDQEYINSEFEKLKRKRNIITHSAPNFSITSNELIESCIRILTTFEGKDSWWRILKEHQVNHPLFGQGDYEDDISLLIFRLEFFKNQTSFGFLNKQSNKELKSRKYLCPSCSMPLQDLGYSEEKIPRWSLLTPNTPESLEIFCYNCQNHFRVKRKKCTNVKCKGNVAHNDKCLTCFDEIDSE